jgi:hypothetical protein
MGLVFRAGSKQMAIGQLAAADSIESSKPMLMQIARLLLPKMKWPPGTWTTSLAQVAPSHPCLLDPRPNTPLEGQRMLGRAFPAELEDRPTDR